MSQNIIFKGGSNPVVIDISIDGSDDLTTFTEVTAKFGSDLRSSITNPVSVIVNSATELELNFQDTAETRSNYWEIKGDGFILTNHCMSNLQKSTVCES